MSSKPTHYAYVVTPAKQDGKRDFWHRVGSVFPHRDGGFDVVIPEGISVTGRVVCREPKAEEAEQAEA